LLTVKNRAYFFDHTSKDLTDYTSRRRSVYLPVVRNNVYDVFQLLDYPDAAVPTGDRTTTTVAPQALMMLNSDFVTRASSDFAQTLLELPTASDESRIVRVYVSSYGREPSPEEIGESLSFLGKVEQALGTMDEHERRLRAWSCLCQVVACSNQRQVTSLGVGSGPKIAIVGKG